MFLYKIIISIRFVDYESILQFLNIGENGDIEVHGQKVVKEKRYCLFCGRSAPEAQFSKIAYAVSETVGNKSLFSHFECDKCNEDFGKFFEDSLGKYLLPYKIVSQIFGNKNQLTAKDISHDEKVNYDTYRIQINKNAQILADIPTKGLIIESDSADILTITNDGFELNIPRQCYTPELVYCAFLKMAYSLLPLKLYLRYVRKIAELHQVSLKDSECFKQQEEKDQYIKQLPNCGILTFASGLNPYDGINVYLMQRKNNITDQPLLLFYIQMANFSFTIPVLSDDEVGNYTMPKFEINENEQYSALDFTTKESNFVCCFSAQKFKLPNKVQLEKILRENHLLK